MKTLRLFLSDTVLLIARVVVGALLILKGWSRMMGQGGMATQIQYLSERQVPAPEVMAWGATILELGAGLFLIFGLLTPLLGALLAIEQILVIVWTNWFNGPAGSPQAPGFALNAALACVGLLFLAFGGGRAAMDQLFKRPKDLGDDDHDADLDHADLSGTDGAPGSTSASDPAANPGLNDGQSSGSSLFRPRD